MAKLGFPILPLKSNEKIPAIIDWQSHACQSEEQISGWAKNFPNCNFGIKTGKGIIVLDVDNKNGKNGSDALASMGQIPETFTVATPSNGFHYYFKTTQDIKTSTSKAGLDIRADGGLVVCPGSTFNDKKYVITNHTILADFPSWLLERLAFNKTQPINHIKFPESYSAEWDDARRATLEKHLSLIDPDLPYEAWIKILFACLNIYGSHQEVWDLLNAWSSEGFKYDQAEFWKKIKSYNPNHLNKAGFNALDETKWEFPKKVAPISKNEFGSQLEKSIFNKVVSILKIHGNNPSTQHEGALNEICKTLAHGINSDEKFRIAFPLETGMGKTSCVIALAYELQQHNKSLLICAERIEQLNEMKEAMIETGVDASKIGIYHALKEFSVPSIESNALHKYQFLLVSHARVISDSKMGNCSKLLEYEGVKRNLTIWDESLITTESYYCSLSEMRWAISDWINRYKEFLLIGKSSVKHNEDYVCLFRFLTELQERLTRENMQDGELIQLPYLPTGGVNPERINTIVSHESYQNALKTLIDFVQLGEVRIIKVKDGFSVMHFKEIIDNSFDKIVVMDASARIKSLLNFDQSIWTSPISVDI